MSDKYNIDKICLKYFQLRPLYKLTTSYMSTFIFGMNTSDSGPKQEWKQGGNGVPWDIVDGGITRGYPACHSLLFTRGLLFKICTSFLSPKFSLTLTFFR